MTGIEQAAFWMAIFFIAFPCYWYIRTKLANASKGKPTPEEQEASRNTL